LKLISLSVARIRRSADMNASCATSSQRPSSRSIRQTKAEMRGK